MLAIENGGGDNQRKLSQSPLRSSKMKPRTFDSVYAYLRAAQADSIDDDSGDERMRGDLLRMMGESKLRYWPLVDQLVFLEDMDAEQRAWPVS